LIPLALAVLFGFLIAPAVVRLERWHFRRIPAAAIVLTVVFTFVGEMGWLVTHQLVTVLNELPNYRVNIHRRIELLRNPTAAGLGKATDSLKEVSKELSDAQAQPGASGTNSLPARDPAAATPPRPVPVEVVGSPPDAVKFLGNPLGSFLGALTTAAGLVVIFTIFMLINREDLRNRFIRLAGRGELNVMTQVLNEASSRISRYLLMQAVVNLTYGLFITLGLYFIGVPYPLLWGHCSRCLGLCRM
jgi:predicted PurR-regulated permease PerM